MPEKLAVPAVQLDVEDVVRRLDMAGYLFAYAAQSFDDMAARFEAIQAAAHAGSLTARLARPGINTCETHDSDFTEQGEDYSVRVEGCPAALPTDPFRRFHSAEYRMDHPRGNCVDKAAAFSICT